MTHCIAPPGLGDVATVAPLLWWPGWVSRPAMAASDELSHTHRQSGLAIPQTRSHSLPEVPDSSSSKF